MVDPQAPCDDGDGDGEPDLCEIEHVWWSWIPSIPGTIISGTESWKDYDGNVAWTGFYGDKEIAGPRYYYPGGTQVPPTSVGARVLGQQVNDRFGTAVGSDGTWLYISAPEHEALKVDVPSLPADRTGAGVVYQLRTDVRVPGQPNLAQLWIEPGTREVPAEDPNDPPTTEFLKWPHVDAEIPTRTDYTMPVPHQYIIETVGSTRGNYDVNTDDFVYADMDSCPKDSLVPIVNSIDKTWATTEPIAFEVSPASEVGGYTPYPTDSAGYYTDRTPQIVGPHGNAKISFVRSLGDVDGDGVRDFAVGSDQIEDPANPGSQVGAIYIVYGRPVGLEGDYLLENLHVDASDPSRLKGIMLKGSSSGERLARVFDDAGDFNGDGFADVVIGNEAAASDAGEVIIILGSEHLESPVNGWTVDGIVTAGKAIRLIGEAAGDLAGSNVAGAGDVDGDGLSDILIAAPGASANRGAVYIIYGSASLSGQVNLADVGTVDLPGAKLTGRVTGDQLGGGTKDVVGTMPGDPSGSFPAYSRGVSALGDIDGDGRDDYAISAMLADPNGRLDSGEVYILYGRGD